MPDNTGRVRAVPEENEADMYGRWESPVGRGIIRQYPVLQEADDRSQICGDSDHPLKFKVINESVKKTDRHDAAMIAEFLEKDMLPEAWLCSEESETIRRLQKEIYSSELPQFS